MFRQLSTLVLILVSCSVLTLFGGCAKAPVAAPSPETPSSGGSPRGVRNGTTVPAADFPYVGILGEFRSTSDPNVLQLYTCTATLLNDHVLLTAAHCVQASVGIPSRIRFAQAYAGLTTAEAAIGRRVILHPNYSSQIIDSVDLALVILDRSLPGPYAQIFEGEAAPDTEMTTVGYGQTETPGAPALKRRGQIRLVETFAARIPNANGSNSSNLTLANAIDRMVAANSANQSICRGDSGGPSFVLVGSDYRLADVSMAVDSSACLLVSSMYLSRLSAHRVWLRTNLMLSSEAVSSSRFVRSLYQDVLGRFPADAEVSAWQAVLAGGAPQGALTQGFLNSTEHRSNVVREHYRQFLFREAAPSEVVAWVHHIETGVRDEDIIAGFVGSDEFFNRAQTIVTDGTATQRFVRSAYLSLLGRAPTSSELAAANGALTGSPAQNRAGIARGILYSIEYRRNLVYGYYVKYLRRSASVSEATAWGNLIGTYTRQEVQAFITGVGATGEYYNLRF